MVKKSVTWKTLLSEEVFSSPWMSIYHNQFELPDGKRGNYFYMHTNGSALIIPVMEDGKLLMIKQYRYLIDEISIEFPCGGIKNGQSALEAARAELIEETGYDTKKIKKIGKFIPYNGLSDEVCTVFLAYKLSFIGSKPDETENIEVFTSTPDEVNRMIQKGKISDGMSLAGWLLGRRYF